MDNAFLVHRPGIKRIVKDPARDKIAGKQRYFISSKIKGEYKTLFGANKACNL